MYDKHYVGEGFSWYRDKLRYSISLRLSCNDLKILDKYFPDKSRSYQIRSVINGYDKLINNCNTKSPG